MVKLPRFTFPKIHWGRRRVLIGVILLVIVTGAVGGNFIYRQPDAAAAKRFAASQ